MSISVPPNAFSQGTAEHVDFEIWAAGIDQFNTAPYLKNKHGKTPHELDYLRGIHRYSTLTTLQSFLTSQLQGTSVRVTSVWLDKASYVIPTITAHKPARRELADLAVLVRRRNMPQYMWLLQAKRSSSSTANLPIDVPTRKEVELLERMPDFNFVRADKTHRLICLKNDFGNIASQFKHWSFLMVKDDPGKYQAMTNPCEWRWPGDQKPLQTGSFAHEILSMCSPQLQPKHGAIVSAGTPNLEWRKLWHELFALSRTKKSGGFAGGDLIHTAFVSRRHPFAFISSADEDGHRYVIQHGPWTKDVDLRLFHEAPSVLTTGYSNNEVDVIASISDPYGIEPLFPEQDFDRTDDVPPSSGGGGNGEIPNEQRDDDGDRPGGGIGQKLVIDILD